jgi:hypothetical protein
MVCWKKPYKNALVVEFGLRGIPYIHNAIRCNTRVSRWRVHPLIVFDKIVVDAKTIDRITILNEDRF